jgi:hypothetical protein
LPRVLPHCEHENTLLVARRNANLRPQPFPDGSAQAAESA